MGTASYAGKSIRLFKSRGQHLLTNSRVLDSIVRSSDIKPDDTVLEIGPGTGNLTLKLLKAAKSVVAVEVDNRMVDILRQRVADAGLQDRLNIVCGDALKIQFPQFNLVVANIPYGISSPLIAKLVYGVEANPFRSATLLLQKEFAKRLMSEPGDSEFNRLAVNVKLVADVEFVMDVSKRDFNPCPKVDSAVVKLYPKEEIPDIYYPEWWAFTRTCFNKKNKTLGAMFKKKRKLMELMRLSRDFNGASLEEKCDSYSSSDEDDDNRGEKASKTGDVYIFRDRIMSILKATGFADKRPSKLSKDELLHLLSALNEAGVHFHDQPKLKDKTWDWEDAYEACDAQL